MILLFYIVVVCFLAVNTVDSSPPCETIVTRYFECKHLKMRVNNESGVYEVDKSVPDNYLNALFYKSILSNMTLERALDLQRDIYLSATTNLNTSFFSRCVSQVNTTRDHLKDSNYGFAFSNDNNEMFYAQFKQVVIDLVNQVGLRNVTEKSASSHSLARFCFKYDILTRTIYDIVQNSNNQTDLENKHEKLMEDCLFPDMDRISFRYLMKEKPGVAFDLKFKEDEEKVAVCRAQAIRNEDFGKAFASIEKRFILGAIYPRGFKNLWRNERNLGLFVESMSRKVSAAERHIMKRKKSGLHLGIRDTNYAFKLITFDGKQKWQKIDENQRVSLFTSSIFNITADIIVNRISFFGYFSLEASVNSITICSVYDPPFKTIYKQSFNHTFQTSDSSLSDMSNENYILDPVNVTDKILIRWLHYRPKDCGGFYRSKNLAYFDFRLNVSISIECESIINVAMPDYLANKAVGGLLLK